jgi:hypothetical protein
MALLDRFRSKPAWQHPDPAARAEAVRHLGPADHDAIVGVLRGDPDPGVRRAALRRVSEVALVAEAARTDADAGVREEAAAALVRLAEQEQAEAAEAALGALDEGRALAGLARSARLPAVRLRALARVSDPHALASLAKAAEDPAVRLGALERVADAAALADIALKTEHKDAGLAALERVVDLDALRGLAARARAKAVARRARERYLAQTGGARPITAEEARTRAAELCHALETLGPSHDWRRVADGLEDARAEWASLGPGLDPAQAERFEAAASLLEKRLAEHEAQQAAAAAREAAHARAAAERVALCERVEALDSENAPALLSELRAAWAALAPLEGPEATELEARFARAGSACLERHAAWMADAERRRQLEALVAGLEAHVPSESGEGQEAFASLRRDFQRLAGTGPFPGELAARAEAAVKRAAELARTTREVRERRAAENRGRLNALCERSLGLAKAEAPALRDAEHALRELRAALADAGPLPGGRHERDAILERLKAARAALYPRLQELREAEEWKLWANVGVQEELCARMEALTTAADLDKAAQELHELGERWRRFSQARKEEAAGLWERFRKAREVIQTRVAEHLRVKAALEAENVQRKRALCERAEALAASTDWLKTAEAIKALQAEWKTIGPGPHREQKALWDRFHGACDRFFTARKQDLSRRKDEWAANLERKEALCAQAEALAGSTDWDKASAELKRLQAEWKAVGPVRRNKADVVWQRFRAACDAFFERHKRRGELEQEAHVAAREVLVAELEALLPAASEAPLPPPDKLAETLQAALQRWRQAPPVAPETGAKLQERLYAARDRAIELWGEALRGSELDPEANRARREKLVLKVEAVLRSFEAAAGQGSGASLAERLKEALATNAMGGRAVAEARWREAQEEVDSAQAAWKRIGPVPGEAGRLLADRFRRAADRFRALRPR